MMQLTLQASEAPVPAPAAVVRIASRTGAPNCWSACCDRNNMRDPSHRSIAPHPVEAARETRLRPPSAARGDLRDRNRAAERLCRQARPRTSLDPQAPASACDGRAETLEALAAEEEKSRTQQGTAQQLRQRHWPRSKQQRQVEAVRCCVAALCLRSRLSLIQLPADVAACFSVLAAVAEFARALRPDCDRSVSSRRKQEGEDAET